MKRFRLDWMFALVAGALALGGMESAHAQYTVEGTTAGGGNIVSGSNTLGTAFSGDGNLTATNGFDSLTLTLGSTVTDTASLGAAILFTTNGDTVLNNGSIFGGAAGSDSEFTNTGLAFFSNGSLSNQTVTNNGLILGGDGGGENTMVNTALAFLAESGSISNVTVVNTGTIAGGSEGGDAFGAINTGVAIMAENGVYNILINNSGVIAGGNFSEFGTILGTGIAIIDFNLSGPEINGVSINNSGMILGGTSSLGFEGEIQTVMAGAAVGVVGFGNVSNISITNTSTGTIVGGWDNTMESGPGPFANILAGTGLGIASMGDFGPIGAETGSPTTLTNVTISNAGNIIGGGSNAVTVDGGSGVALIASGTITNVAITNSGTVQGGSTNEFGLNLGNGITLNSGIVFTFEPVFAQSAISNVTITNSGVISGGSDSFESIAAGNGISFFTGAPFIEEEANSGVISGVAIHNSGIIRGGNGNEGEEEQSSSMGGGIAFANFTIAGTISNITINNSGAILGGSFGNSSAWMVGEGIGIIGGSVNGVTITNTGFISGGSGNSFDSDYTGSGIVIIGTDFLSENSSISNVGIYNAGVVAGGSDAGFKEGTGDAINLDAALVSGVTITNTGFILGGNSSNPKSSGGDGISIFSGTISNVTIQNYNLIQGGDGAGGGDGIVINAGFDPDLVIDNMTGGIIRGGNGIAGGSNAGGNGLSLFISNASNAVVNNHGSILGGNASAGGFAGEGIHAEANGLTINNYGVIAAGAGASQAVVNGFPAVAVSVSGNNNSINLYDHSAVYGTLEGSKGANNVLNLKFTGVSPQEYQALVQQLEAQGWSPANPSFTGLFTLRGVTYYVDPLILTISGITSYQLQGLTPNQSAVGASLDSAIVNPTGPLLALYNTIDASGNVPAALEALSPQPYQIYGDIAEAWANNLTLSIDARLNNLRDGSESIDTTGIGGGTDKTTAGFDKDGKNVVVPAKQGVERRWGFFAQGSGYIADISAHGPDLQRGNFTTTGLLLGVDGKVNDNLVVGALFNYNYTTASLDARGSEANVQTFAGGLYAGYHNGGWYGNGLAVYGSNTYDSKRHITFPGFASVASGSTDGDQEEANIDGGYDFHINDHFTVGPLAGLQYLHLGVDGFNESGAGAASLAVGSQDVDSLRSRLGFRADYHTQIAKDVAFAAELRVAWQHEFLDDSRAIGGSFIGSGLAPFAVHTTSPERDAALLGVGINFTVRDRATLFFDYDVQAGQASYLEQSVRGGLKLSF